MVEIEILLNEELLSFGVTSWLSWNPQKAPHFLITGATNSGKTYFSKLILGKISTYIQNSKVFLCDFKGDEDFLYLQNSPRFYRFMNCSVGLQEFYDILLARQSGVDTNRDMLLLFFDEWVSYLNFIDKKNSEEEKKKLSNLLMLGRSFNMFVIVAVQRPDAQYFSTARDNFNFIVSLGNLSEEGKDMLFREFKKTMKSDRRQGTGYMLTNGTNLQSVQVPTITNMEKLYKAIKEAVIR